MTIQNELNKFLDDNHIDRRDFLKWAGALGVASGGALALGYELFGQLPATASAAGSAFTPLRPPATPLIVRGPYVNTWLAADNSAGTWPTFWNDIEARNVKAITGIARIDGNPYIFLGAPGGIGTVGTMTQTSLQITATQSIFTLQAGGVTLTLTFLSPVEPTDFQRQSIPLSYIFAQVQSNDGKSHNVSLYFDISAEWAHSDTTQQVRWSRNQVAHNNGGSLTSMSFSLVSPHVLSEFSQYPQWGYPVWATANISGLTTQIGQDTVVRSAAAHSGTLNNGIDGAQPRAIHDRWPVLGFNFALGNIGTTSHTVDLALGHVRTPVVSYLGQQLKPLWQSHWSTSDQMLAFFYDDATAARQRAGQLDSKITSAATSVGGANYAAICALATRQAFGGLELVNSPSNTPWLVLKELSTGGGFSTVDVVYPAFPILLYLNPELIPPFIEPILTYTESGNWPQRFCVHDLGGYPNGGGHNDGGGENMPVEESANMLILAATYLRYTGSNTTATAYAQKHYGILKQWADYLNAGNGGNPNRPNALDPLFQNQTDDFTGSIAHSTNLALKGIIGIGAMGIIAQVAGNNGDAQFYHNTATNLIGQWANLGQDPTNTHLDIAYRESDTANNTGAGTYSLKYNSFPDKVLGLNLVSQSVLQEEATYYKTKENTYGIPLDSRHNWIKTDWALWAAAGMGDATLKQYFINAIYKYVNTTPDRAPFTDLYETNTGRQSGNGFIARPVIGGVFTLLNLTQTRKR